MFVRSGKVPFAFRLVRRGSRRRGSIGIHAIEKLVESHIEDIAAADLRVRLFARDIEAKRA